MTYDKRRRRRTLLCASALVAGNLLASPSAFAQAEPQQAAQGGIADIIVTANRRQENNQDVPVAITALSADRLQQQGIGKEQDLQASVPSLVVGPNGQGSREAQSFTLRGQGATFQASPGVVTYMNEVPLPSAITLSQQGGPGNFLDLENMQVLAGPQGTLFGRNTTGGAVLLTPKKPKNEFGGWIQGTIGNYNARIIEGALNVPIVDDKLMVRVAGAYNDRDGYTQDVVWNKDRDNQHWYTGRLGVLFRPTETIENYTMLYGSRSRNNGAGLIHRQFNIDGLKAINLCSDAPGAGAASCDVYRATSAQANALGPRKTAFSIDTFSETETWGISNTTDFELNDQLTLRNIASYQRMRLRYRYDSDATVLQQHDVDPGVLPAPGQVTLPGVGTPVTYLNDTASKEVPRDNFEQITEELQLQGELFDKLLSFTAGGFYFKQQPAGTQGGASIFYCPASFTGFCDSSTQRYASTQESKALYAQATLDFGLLSPALDGLRLTGGYRHTWDKITGFSTNIQPNPTAPGTVNCGATGERGVPIADQFERCTFTVGLKTNAPTWTVGLDYKVSPRILLFGKVSRGYKAGGLNALAVYDFKRTFLPEYVTSYEAGVKSDFSIANVPFRFNAVAYHVDFKDIQRAGADFNPTTGAGGSQIFNADARIRGVELDASMQPFQGLEIGGNFSHTDAKYKKFTFTSSTGQADCNGGVGPGGTADFACLPFQYVAPYIWSLHVNAEIPVGDDMGKLNFFANYSHTASQYTDTTAMPFEQPGARLEAFGLLNMSLDWRDVARSGVDLGLFVTNATNKLYRISNSNVYQQTGGLLYQASLYGEPRMYGLRLKYRFGGE
ncbi:TonB-dependent receptor [Sphingobium sp. HWE2-09]|uniref:TonB-dependent receptor n=1 Tax=Sphingobium sp. HWE2-09 TaxID=3108390 RepID=UPI002DC77E27|nr:TonB-dependent receptor [Sphingobium sp. HWE2-09]